ncbi:hypothetical protein Ahy_B01g053916 [Arachis hypogaea]|uniref:Uncharacterized protein n=1 Tax=Arachis hypogaea TaxID=3818 RepID=A0A445ASW0_ARAHY|nr:hypothetical protein Ahy_B01g053916 [Arachis hypogaea]
MISLSLSLLRTVVGLDHMAWHVVSTITLCCYKDNNTAMAASVSTIGAIKGTLINNNVAMCLGLEMAGVYLAERLNTVLRMNWKSFSS